MTDKTPHFGRYMVLDELVGNNGERTLVAYDPELDRKVGLKVFPVASEQAQDWRRDRARVLAGLVHPHVVRVHDVGAVEGRQFAAMDFVEGCTVVPWLERDRPGWPRILEVFIAAGDGLAAAHAADLVHGRFGLDALVIGDDQQVRVIDFLRTSPQLGPAPREDDDRRDWAAALYEALWGQPPGERPEPPSTTSVPRRVRRLVLDGLRSRPSPKTPTLAALVEALRAARRQRRRLGAAAVLLLATGVSAAVVMRPATAPAARTWCDEVNERLEQLWNPQVIERGRAAFEATKAPFAADAWTQVETSVNLFVAQWRQTQQARCLDNPTESRRAAATVCLHRQLQVLEAFVQALETADDATVLNAAEIAASLGSPASCGVGSGDAVLNTADIDLDEVLAIETVLSRARMQLSLSHYEQSLALAQDARERAEALGLRALAAEAHHTMANTYRDLAREDEAERAFHTAFDAAVASGHHEIVGRSSMQLAKLLAEQGRDNEAKRWIEHSAAAVERHDTPALRTQLANAQGLVAYRKGDHPAARAHYERSIELAEQENPPNQFAKIKASQALGNVLGRMGENREQIEILERSLVAARVELYPMHPTIGHHLNSLATALARRGSTTLALEHQKEALDLFETVFGPDHANTIAARSGYAAVLHESGQDKEASRTYTLALESAKRTFSTDDARYVNVLGNVGMFYALQQDYDAAAELLAEAATRNEQIHGPDHEWTLGYLNNLAATYMFAGNLDEARTSYEEIIARTERALGAEHPQLIPALLGLSDILVKEGDSTAAIPHLERALELSIAKQVRPERLGAVQFSLAQALWDSERAHERAQAMGRAAVQSFITAKDGGWNAGDRVDEIRQWLDDHSGG